MGSSKSCSTAGPELDSKDAGHGRDSGDCALIVIKFALRSISLAEDWSKSELDLGNFGLDRGLGELRGDRPLRFVSERFSFEGRWD